MQPSRSTTTSIPYFPPPPRSATLPDSKSRSSSVKTRRLKSARSSKSPRSLLHRSRSFLVPVLLIVTLAIVILSVIFGYCVATPHTQVTAGQADDQYHSPTAALVFYLLACPVVLLCLFCVELLLHHHYYHLNGSGHGHARSMFNLNARLPSFLVLLVHMVVWPAFTLSTAFWTACELPPPTSTASERMCPAQVRGHFMYGIHELSIAKVAMGWFVVVGLAAHVWCQVKTRRSSRRLRWASTNAGLNEYGGSKADVEVISIDEPDHGLTAAAAAAETRENNTGGLFAGSLRRLRGSLA